jgi:hypothetical protein
MRYLPILLLLLAACSTEPEPEIEFNQTTAPDTIMPIERGTIEVKSITARADMFDILVDIKSDIDPSQLTFDFEENKVTFYEGDLETCDFILNATKYCYESTNEDYDGKLEKGETITIKYLADMITKPGEEWTFRFYVDDIEVASQSGRWEEEGE